MLIARKPREKLRDARSMPESQNRDRDSDRYLKKDRRS